MRKTLAALCGFFIACGIAQAQSGIGTLTASGADCTTVGACVSVAFSSTDNNSASIQLSGAFTATVQFEASSDNGTTWVAISGTPLNSSTAVTSATTANTWKFNVASLTSIRARCSAFTSAPTVVIHTSKAVANAIGGGAVYASGNGAVNVIPKGNGANQLADSSVTDDGTSLTTTDILVLPATSSATVVGGVKGTGTSTGLNFQSTQLQLMSGGLRIGAVTSTGLAIAANTLFTWSGTSNDALGSANDSFFGRDSARVLRVGNAALAAPQANTLQVGESSRSGTDTDTAGSSGSIRPGDGTGLGAATKLCLQRNIMGSATASTAQTQIDGYCVGPSKKLSNTSATAQSLVNISVPSNSAGGVEGTITITCTDGTNFDAETQSFNTSFVNKAGTLTVTAPVITATTAANNSGSCTAGITAVAGTNSVDIKVTPVLSTIVPTTVTSYIALRNNGTGNVTFN
jgi:hypothetical protein